MRGEKEGAARKELRIKEGPWSKETGVNKMTKYMGSRTEKGS